MDLWIYSLNENGVRYGDDLTILSQEERKRAEKFVFDVHRFRYASGRAQLRRILGRYLDCPPEEVRFIYNEFGKPALAPETDLRFNVSHSENVAAYAVCRGGEIGVDIERVQPRYAQEGIPERFFGAGEVRALRALPMFQQDRGFFRCWTRKESYIKARAEGLSIPLDSFEVTLEPNEPARFVRGGEGFGLWSFEWGAEFLGAICVEGDVGVVRQEVLAPPPR